ncbi:MAG: hypothetical protein QOF03_1502 [Alphaproteobacteria bacterium]|nr:hypothetical protein [Alphaproteobacteria bacterium]
MAVSDWICNSSDEKNVANSFAETDPSPLLSRLARELGALLLEVPLDAALGVGAAAPRPAAVNSAADNVPSLLLSSPPKICEARSVEDVSPDEDGGASAA